MNIEQSGTTDTLPQSVANPISMSGTMRAIVQERYGSPDVLELREIDMPNVSDDEVLIRVRAASVHADVWHAVHGVPYVLRIMGSGLRTPKHPVPGTDLAGGSPVARPGGVGAASEPVPGHDHPTGGDHRAAGRHPRRHDRLDRPALTGSTGLRRDRRHRRSPPRR